MEEGNFGDSLRKKIYPVAKIKEGLYLFIAYFYFSSLSQTSRALVNELIPHLNESNTKNKIIKKILIAIDIYTNKASQNFTKKYMNENHLCSYV